MQNVRLRAIQARTEYDLGINDNSVKNCCGVCGSDKFQIYDLNPFISLFIRSLRGKGFVCGCKKCGYITNDHISAAEAVRKFREKV